MILSDVLQCTVPPLRAELSLKTPYSSKDKNDCNNSANPPAPTFLVRELCEELLSVGRTHRPVLIPADVEPDVVLRR